MAEGRQYSYSDAVKVGSRKAAKAFLRDAAALLAGAEALDALPLAQEQAAKVWGLVCERDDLKAALEAKREAVKVAKAALSEIVGLSASAAYLPPHQPTATKAIETARAALARLEGK
jgi:hypothetical protein